MNRPILPAVPCSSLALGALAALVSLGGCGSGAVPPSPASTAADLPPLPDDLERLDAQARAVIVAAHEDAARHPGHAATWLRLAMALHANAYDGFALDPYGRAVALDPTNARAWYHRGRVLARLGRSDEAEASLRRAAALDPSSATVQSRLGRLLLDAGRYVDAEEAFRRSMAIDGADAAGWLGLARVQIAAGRAAEAIGLLEPKLERGGANEGYLRHLLATAYRQAGRGAEAAAIAARGIDAAPVWTDRWDADLDEFRAGLGARSARISALLEARRFDEAIGLLRSVIDERPDNVTALARLGLALRETRRIPESIEILERAVAIDEGFSLAHFHLAAAYMTSAVAGSDAAAREARRLAVRHADRAIALNPTYAPAHALRGDLHLRAGERESALAEYREAARCDGEDPRWPFRCGVVLLEAGRWSEAADLLERAATLGPTDSESWRALGLALTNLGDLDRASAALDRAARLSPNDPRVASTVDHLRAVRGGARPGSGRSSKPHGSDP